MDWDAMISYLPLYKDALLLTVKIGWQGVLLAFVIGVLCAVITHLKVPVLRQITGIYIELFRNTPLLVQLFFIIFCSPENRNPHFSTALRKPRSRSFGRRLYDRDLPQRFGKYSADPVGKRTKSWYEQIASLSLCHPATGSFFQRTGTSCQCDLPAERNQRIFNHQPDGSDVYCKRPYRNVCENHRMFNFAGTILSDYAAACVHIRQLCGKEAAPCRVWELTFFSKERTF